MYKKDITEIKEESMMEHMLGLILNGVDRKDWYKKAKAHELQIKHSIIIRLIIANGYVEGKTTQQVYELYKYVCDNRICMTKIQLTKTLTKYYGFKVISKRCNGKNQRVYIANYSKDYETSDDFLKNCKDIEIKNVITNEVYDEYSDYCKKIGLLPINKGEFSKQVKKYFNFVIIDKKIQGKKCRIFKEQVQ